MSVDVAFRGVTDSCKIYTARYNSPRPPPAAYRLLSRRDKSARVISGWVTGRHSARDRSCGRALPVGGLSIKKRQQTFRPGCACFIIASSRRSECYFSFPWKSPVSLHDCKMRYCRDNGRIRNQDLRSTFVKRDASWFHAPRKLTAN